jgi:hypothetical protein
MNYKKNVVSIVCNLTLVVILGLLFLTQSANAQFGGASGAFMRIGFGPRALSVSNAVLSVPEVGNFGFYNPAISAGAYKRSAEFGSSVMTFDRNLHTLGLSVQLPPSAGMSLLLMNAGVSNIDGRTLSGYPTESLTAQDYYFHASFGVQAKKRLWFGAGLKFILSDYHPDMSSSLGFGIDLGLLWKATDELFIALAVRDILLSHQWNSSDLYGGLEQANASAAFPTTFAAGLSYRMLDNRLILSSDFLVTQYSAQILERGISSNFLPPTENSVRTDVSSAVFGLNTGISYQLHTRFRLSAGYANRDISGLGDQHTFSSGFTLLLPYDRFSPSIDYALNREPNLGSLIHTFSLRFNF